MLLQEASKHPGDYFEILLALFAELRGGEVRGYGMRTLIQKNIQSAWLASIRQIILWRIAMDNFLVPTIWKKKIQRVQVPVFCEWLIFYCQQLNFPDMYLPLLLSLTLGSRISETLGLRYSDVDFSAETIYIRIQLGRSIEDNSEESLLTKPIKTVYGAYRRQDG